MREIVNYSEIAYNHLDLAEGIDVINYFLIEVVKQHNPTVVHLSQALRIPLPITVAIRNELIKAGAVRKGNYVNLTSGGKNFVEESLGYKGFNYLRWQQLMNNESMFIEELAEKYAVVYNERPTIDSTLDQVKCTAETSLKRAVFALKNNCLIGKEIVCLGDDDLLSVSISIVLREILTEQNHQAEVCAIEIDSRILRYIKQVSDAYNFRIKLYHLDARHALPDELIGRFNTVFTDPPYTLNGARLFLSRSTEIIKKNEGQNIFFSIGHKTARFNFEIQKMIHCMGLEIKELIRDFNHYEGAKIIGGRSQFYYLTTTDKVSSLVNHAYEEFIYTGQVTQTVRLFECAHCLTQYEVGSRQKIQTIEKLKEQTCQECGHHKFKLIRRKKHEVDRC